MSVKINNEKLVHDSIVLSVTPKGNDGKSDLESEDVKLGTRVSGDVHKNNLQKKNKPRENLPEHKKKFFDQKEKYEAEKKEKRKKLGTRSKKKGPCLKNISFLEQYWDPKKHSILKYGEKKIIEMFHVEEIELRQFYMWRFFMELEFNHFWIATYYVKVIRECKRSNIEFNLVRGSDKQSVEYTSAGPRDNFRIILPGYMPMQFEYQYELFWYYDKRKNANCPDIKSFRAGVHFDFQYCFQPKNIVGKFYDRWHSKKISIKDAQETAYDSSNLTMRKINKIDNLLGPERRDDLEHVSIQEGLAIMQSGPIIDPKMELEDLDLTQITGSSSSSSSSSSVFGYSAELTDAAKKLQETLDSIPIDDKDYDVNNTNSSVEQSSGLRNFLSDSWKFATSPFSAAQKVEKVAGDIETEVKETAGAIKGFMSRSEKRMQDASERIDKIVDSMKDQLTKSIESLSAFLPSGRTIISVSSLIIAIIELIDFARKPSKRAAAVIAASLASFSVAVKSSFSPAKVSLESVAQGFGASIVSVLKTVSNMIVEFFCGVKALVSWQNFMETMKAASVIGRGLQGIKYAYTFISEVVEFIRNYLIEKITGVPAFLSCNDKITASFDQWRTSSMRLLSLYGERVASMESIIAYHSNIAQGEYYLSQASLYSTGLTKFRSGIQSVIERLRGKCTLACDLDSAGFRPPPFVVLMHGDSHMGKSVACQDILSEIAECVFHKKRGFASIYPRADTNYWDNYCGQPILFYDDWMQTKDTPGKPNENLIDLIRMANAAPFMLNMANVSSKGNVFFNSKLVLLNSNINPATLDGYVQSVVSPDAVRNRIHFQVKKTVKYDPTNLNLPMYQVECIRVDGVKFDGNKLLTYRELMSMIMMTWMHHYKLSLKMLDRKHELERLFRTDETNGSFKDFVDHNDQVYNMFKDPKTDEIVLTAPGKIDGRCGMHRAYFKEPDEKWDLFCLCAENVIDKPTLVEAKDFQSYAAVFPIGDHKVVFDLAAVNEVGMWMAKNKEKWAPVSAIDEYLLTDKACTSSSQLHNVVYINMLYWQNKYKLPDNTAFMCVCRRTQQTVTSLPVPVKTSVHCDIDLLKDGVDSPIVPYAKTLVYLGLGTMAGLLYYLFDAFYTQPLEKKKWKKAIMQSYNQQNAISSIRGRMNSDVVDKPLIDNNALEQVVKVVSNVVYLHYLHQDNTWRFVLSGLCLDEFHILLPKHWKFLVPEGGFIKILCPQGKKGVGWSFVQKVSDLNIQEIDDIDAVIIKKYCTNGIRKISHLFVDEKDVKKGSNDIGFLVGGSKNEELRTSPLVRIVKGVRYSENPIKYSDGEQILETRAHFMYEIPTDIGDCGSVLIAHNPSLGSKILGHHLLNIRNTIDGASCVITKQMILRTLDKFGDKVKIADMQANVKDICPSFTLVNSSGTKQMTHDAQYEFSGVQYIGKIHPWSAMPSNDVIPSKLHNWLPHREKKTAPAIISPEVRSLALEKVGQPDVYVSKKILEMAINNYTNLILSQRTHREKKVVTLYEAIFGVANDEFFPSINVSSSPGYEWKKMSDHTGGKNKWINLQTKFVHEDIKDAVNKRLTFAKLGVVIPVIWEDVCKIERRPLEKIVEKKTRVFSSGPVDFTILFRMYFGAFISYMMHNRVRNESAVGINPMSVEWTVLAEYLKVASEDNIIAGDFSNYDGTQNITILWAILDVVNTWYGNEEDNKIRVILWHGIMSSIHVAGDKLYAWHHSNPSGNPMTTLINTMYNCIVFRYVWFTNYPFKNFNQYVRMVAYGDDNVISVTDEAKDLFTPTLISEGLSRLGMKYTNTSKTGDVRFLKLKEVTFLKRSFVFKECFCLAPLDLETILEIPCWTKRGLPLDVFIESLSGVNDELALHGPETFAIYSRLLKQACYDVKIPFMAWMSYHQVIDRMFNKI